MSENWFWRFMDWYMGICHHDWIEYENNSMKRYCLKCARVEWLFGNPCPVPGEPAYEWKVMR